MINLLLGQPGGGKSYEAVAFHVIPAVVEKKRKVITNLPLKLDMWEQFFPGSTKLIEIRGNYKHNNKLYRPFSREEDYQDDWKDEVTDVGPLYIIDECHKSLPRKGTPVAVEEWYAEHRHSGADVLLITQSYGKINSAIRDAVQVVYRCKKAVAFGSSDKYIRKVQDGIRGDVVNTSIREYEKKYFPLYKSHTKSSGSVQEAFASDIVPFWRRWPILGAMVFGVLFVVFTGYNISQLGKDKPKKEEPVKVNYTMSTDVNRAVERAVPQPTPRGPEKKMHPYDGATMHLQALLRGKRFRDGKEEEFLAGYVIIAQNSQPIRRVSFRDLWDSGYEIVMLSSTVISVSYKGYDVGYVVSDLPTTSMTKNTPDKVMAKN